METRTEQIITFVRELDALELERKRAVAPIDARIADIKQAIARLIGDAPTGEVPTRRKSEIGGKFLALAAEQPNCGIGELAIALYGNDTPQNRHRTRAQAFNLKRAGKLRGSAGAWQVVPANGHAERTALM